MIHATVKRLSWACPRCLVFSLVMKVATAMLRWPANFPLELTKRSARRLSPSQKVNENFCKFVCLVLFLIRFI
jgi:hypothetical protein